MQLAHTGIRKPTVLLGDLANRPTQLSDELRPPGLVGALIAELVAARLAGGATCVLVVRTGSMAPLLRPGDSVRVTPLGGEEPQRGAVLVVHQDSFLLTHRLVGWAGEQLLLQGDACLRPDQPVAANAVLGVVVARRRGGRWQRLPNRGWRYNDVLSWGFGVLGLLLRRTKTLRPSKTKPS